MTRITGHNIIACPTCGRRYRASHFASMNYSGWRQWSDGHGEGRLYRPIPDARSCGCGALYLASQAQIVSFVGVIRGEANYAPYPRDPGLIRRLWWRLTGKEPVEPETPEFPRRSIVIKGEDLERVIATLPAEIHPDIEIALRRQWWWHLNDHERLPTPPRPTVATQRATVLQSANLERLHALLSWRTAPDWLEIGEALRELGRFDEARQCFARVPGFQVEAATFLTTLADAGDTRVALMDMEMPSDDPALRATLWILDP